MVLWRLVKHSNNSNGYSIGWSPEIILNRNTKDAISYRGRGEIGRAEIPHPPAKGAKCGRGGGDQKKAANI